MSRAEQANPAYEAVLARRSYSKVTEQAPSRDELLPLVAAVSRVADHSSLKPWRLIELRGDAREKLGRAFAADAQLTGHAADKLAAKPLRAALLIAVVAVRRPSEKIPKWEQDATAAGVAHLLSLLLHEAGWGVMWRTGSHTRAKTVAKVHELAPNERLLGWLYVGGIEKVQSGGGKKPVDPELFLSAL